MFKRRIATRRDRRNETPDPGSQDGRRDRFPSTAAQGRARTRRRGCRAEARQRVLRNKALVGGARCGERRARRPSPQDARTANLTAPPLDRVGDRGCGPPSQLRQSSATRRSRPARDSAAFERATSRRSPTSPRRPKRPAPGRARPEPAKRTSARAGGARRTAGRSVVWWLEEAIEGLVSRADLRESAGYSTLPSKTHAESNDSRTGESIPGDGRPGEGRRGGSRTAFTPRQSGSSNTWRRNADSTVTIAIGLPGEHCSARHDQPPAPRLSAATLVTATNYRTLRDMDRAAVPVSSARTGAK